MKLHNIKCTSDFYKLITSGVKRVEVRENDRDYQFGDFIVFWELDPNGLETGVKSKKFDVSGYVLKHEDFPDGLKEKYCCFPIKEIE